MVLELSLTEQRDRFVAFAFAASDVLMEVDQDGVVIFVSGSVKSLLGHSTNELMGTKVTNIAAHEDWVVFTEFLKKLQVTGRASDRLITLKSDDDKLHQVSVSGMSSPQRRGIHHLAIKRVPLAGRRSAAQVPEQPMNVLDFANSSAAMGLAARESGEEVNFTMYDVGWDHVESTINPHEAKALNETLVHTMRAWAAGGSGVGQVGKGKYSLLLDEGIDPQSLSNRIAEVAKERHSGLNLNISQTALSLSDVIDTDDFSAKFEDAMAYFDKVGGEKFNLDNFSEVPSKKPKSPAPPPSATLTASQRARRKGTTEGWG
ncbi:MAG: PAS domain S-box protein [Alphaproteobacteria bacterium]|nr:PAS domain S-box protein [Alphaproteobacteria bacterium]